MDLQDQLKKLFPEHEFQEEDKTEETSAEFWIQDEPILCKYEKRRGKPHTILEGYNGTDEDFKKMTKALKTMLGVGGSFKNEQIIIQGDYRPQIMEWLKKQGFEVKRVGG